MCTVQLSSSDRQRCKSLSHHQFDCTHVNCEEIKMCPNICWGPMLPMAIKGKKSKYIWIRQRKGRPSQPDRGYVSRVKGKWTKKNIKIDKRMKNDISCNLIWIRIPAAESNIEKRSPFKIEMRRIYKFSTRFFLWFRGPIPQTSIAMQIRPFLFNKEQLNYIVSSSISFVSTFSIHTY